jgi:gliding motility-associated-like protein
MRKLSLVFTAAIFSLAGAAQNPATIFTIPNRNIVLPCGTNCTSISAQVPHIKQSTTYVITNPAYKPYPYTTTTGTEMPVFYDNATGDDHWSPVIALPFAFSFCFYGLTYNSLLMGSNSAITFDITKAGSASGYVINSGGTIPSSSYAPAMIFGPYHDIDPRDDYNPSPTQRKVEWRVEGTAPARRFIASYNSVALFSGVNCGNITATHQMVLYENTGIIEVYIKDKAACPSWNGGLAILGAQDQTQTKAVAAPGKNATVWGTDNMDSAYRFIPSGGAATFKRAQLLVNNVVVATNTTDTSTASPGVLNLNFPNVCPTADSTAYVIKVFYGSCSNPALDVSFTDTVFIKKNTLGATVAKADATCIVNGTITVTATGGVAPLQYSINGGTTYQSSNIFTNVLPGTYSVVTRDAGTCPVTVPVTIVLAGAISVTAGSDTLICTGASFTRGAISTATSYSWSPTAGVSNPLISNPVFSPLVTTNYTVTATTGNCTAQDLFIVEVVPGATITAGPDAVILSGQVYLMQASGSPGSYLWTPATGLNASNILNPSANPTQTTTYTVKVTTPQGCIASDDMILTVVPYCIKPMEAFTPNGDGINDLWLVTNGTGCLDKAKAQVFNRYGAKVFESNDYKNNWKGDFEGKPLADGTYYYVITFKLITGREEHLKGSLTILR